MRRHISRACALAPSLLLPACSAHAIDDLSRADGEKNGTPALPAVESVRADTPAPLGQVARVDSARTFALDRIFESGLSRVSEFRALGEHVADDGSVHVRLQQTYRGVDVYGADVVVHQSATDNEFLSGNVVGDLADFDVTPALSREFALAKAVSDVAKGQAIETAREDARLIVYREESAEPRLAWHVEFFTELQDAVGPGLWNHIIDAKSGETLAHWNGIHTLSQASGPGGNAKHPVSWRESLDVEPATGGNFKMETARLRTLNLNNAQSGGTVVTGSLTNIGDAAINDAHGYAEVTINMLQEWHGYNSINNRGYRIQSRVHYGRNYENAFWDGSQMTYGDGASIFHPLSGDVDVVSHEIHHGFTTFHSNLRYSGEPGGLNEGFSDIAGTVAAFYFEPERATFDIGSHIFKEDGALRYMCDPTRDGRSIDTAARMTPSLDPHYSSGVPNKAFCRAALRFSTAGGVSGEHSQAGVKRASQPFFRANAAYWTTSTTFVQGCQGTLDAARAMGFSPQEIDWLRQSWIDVGVTCGSPSTPPPSGGLRCDETLTSTSGVLTSPNHPSAYGNNFARTYCIAPATGSARLQFTVFDTERNYDFVEILDADGKRVTRTSGTTAPAAYTGTKIGLRFTTDGSVTRPGFRATWASP